MADKSIEEKVKDIIVEQLGVNPEQVTPQASFIEDLGADSLDIVELVMAFEEAFELEIPDEDADNVGFHEASNLRFALCEIAVQAYILGYVHQSSDNLQIAGCIVQNAAQHMYELH